MCMSIQAKEKKLNNRLEKKKGPSSVSNCEVKMVVICVHGMLAGTSESANRHDFCWKLVFGLGLLSLLRLSKSFDCHFTPHSEKQHSPNAAIRLSNYHHLFRSKKNIKCTLLVRRIEIKLVNKLKLWSTHSVNICSLLMPNCVEVSCVILQLRRMILQSIASVLFSELCVQIFNTKFSTHLNHERLISIPISLHHFLNA